MCLTYKEKIYLFGGMKENKQRYQNILRYDDGKDSWTSLKFSFPFGL